MKNLLFVSLLFVSLFSTAQISTRCKVCPPSLEGVPDGYALRDSSGYARWQSVAGFDTTAIGVDSLSNLFWNINGNSGTTAGTNFIGTTDDQPLFIKAYNGAQEIRVYTNSNFRVIDSADEVDKFIVDVANNISSFRTSLRIKDGTEGDGEVFTSDANGNGSWQPLATDTTWSPTVTLVGGTGNTTPVYTTNLARYEKIGNIVFCSVELLGDGGAEGAGTGVINIALPVAAGNNQLHIEYPCGRAINGATEHILFGTISANSTTVTLSQQTAANSTTPFQGNDQNNTSRHIDLQFWYKVD